jgi:uncharacterized protein
VTPARFWAATVLFHIVVLAVSWRVARTWRDSSRCRLPSVSWLGALARDVASVALFAYAISLVAPTVTNLGDLARLRVGSISGRLMGQFLFGEAILFGIVQAVLHRRVGRPARGAVLGVAALGLFGVYVEGYRIEPKMLRVRQHLVDEAAGATGGAAIRILHITDIQTPVIGPHEERALRTGMSYHPDLIVLTGDYVQDALGRPTEEQAARDLRELMTRIGFLAPLGVFATEGDVGPSCGAVFAGTVVRCLADESALVTLPGGDTLSITGLSRGGGRARDSVWLARLLDGSPPADHRIVLSHSPDFIDSMPERVDLVLAGHTHGGQVVLPLFGPPKTASRLPRLYAGGLHNYAGIPLHVSRGVGMERGFDVPIRFLCPPEICVVELRLPVRRTDRSS